MYLVRMAPRIHGTTSLAEWKYRRPWANPWKRPPVMLRCGPAAIPGLHERLSYACRIRPVMFRLLLTQNRVSRSPSRVRTVQPGTTAEPFEPTTVTDFTRPDTPRTKFRKSCTVPIPSLSLDVTPDAPNPADQLSRILVLSLAEVMSYSAGSQTPRR